MTNPQYKQLVYIVEELEALSKMVRTIPELKPAATLLVVARHLAVQHSTVIDNRDNP